jgi:hypothetical protein
MNALLEHPHPRNGNGETVFSVLAERARTDSRARLATYLALGLVAAALVLLFAPTWWPAAALAVSLASFGAFGLVRPIDSLGIMRRVIAFVGTTAAIVFLIGCFFVAFTGNARGTYTPAKDALPLSHPPATATELPPSLRK